MSFLKSEESDLRELQRSVARIIADKKNAEEVLREMCGRLILTQSPSMMLCRVVTESTIQSEFFGLLMRVLAADLRKVINMASPALHPVPTWKVSLLVLFPSKELQHMRKIIIRVCSESNVPSLLLKVGEIVPAAAETIYGVLADLVTHKEVFKDLTMTSSLASIAAPLHNAILYSESSRAQCDACVRAILEHHRKEPNIVALVTGSVLPGLATKQAMVSPNSATDVLCLVHYISGVTSLPDVLTALSIAGFASMLSDCVKDFSTLDENQCTTLFARLQAMAMLPDVQPAKQPQEETIPRSSWASVLSKVVSTAKAVTGTSASVTTMPWASTGHASHGEYLESIVKIVMGRSEAHVHAIGVRHVRELLLAHSGNYRSLHGRTHLITILRKLHTLAPPTQVVVVRLVDELVVKHSVPMSEEVMGLIAGMHHPLPAATAIACFGALQKLLADTRTAQHVLESGVLSVLHHLLASVSVGTPLYAPEGPDETAAVRAATKALILSIVSSKQGLAAVVSDTFVPTAVSMVSSANDNAMAREVLETLIPYCTNFVTYSMIDHFRAQTTLSDVIELLATVARNKKLVVSFLQNDGVAALTSGPLRDDDHTGVGTHASAVLCGLLTSLLLCSPQNEDATLSLAEKVNWNVSLVLDCITGTAACAKYFDVQMGEGVSWSVGAATSGYDSLVVPAVLNEVCHMNLFREKKDLYALAVLATRLPIVSDKIIPYSDFLFSQLESGPCEDGVSALLRVLLLASACTARRYHRAMAMVTAHPVTLADYLDVALRDEDASDAFFTPHIILFPHSSMTIRNISFTDQTVWPPSAGYSISIWVRHHIPDNEHDTTPRPLCRCQWQDQAIDGGDAPCFVQLAILPCGGTVVTLNLSTASSMVSAPVTREARFPSCVLIPGTWHNIVLVHTKLRMFSGEMSLYRNGVLMATAPESYPWAAFTTGTGGGPTVMSVTMFSQEQVLHYGPVALFDEPLTATQVEGVFCPRIVHHKKRSTDFIKIAKMRTMGRVVKRWIGMQPVSAISGGQISMPLFPSSCLFFVSPSCMTSPTSFSETSGRSKLSQAYVDGLHAAPWFPGGNNILSSVRANRSVMKAVLDGICKEPRLLQFVIRLMDVEDEEDAGYYMSIGNAVKHTIAPAMPILLAGCELEIRAGKYLISNLLLVEHVLLSPMFWGAMTDTQCIAMIKHMTSRWLLVSEPHCGLNAARLQQCHFLHRVLTSICIHMKGITVVIHVFEAMKQYYLCGGLNPKDTHILCGVLNQFCGGQALLGIPGVCVAFRDTVLNLLLRVMCDLSCTHTVALGTAIAKVISPAWFLRFLDTDVHSVTRTLALYLFASVMSTNQQFQYAAEKCHVLRSMRHILCQEQTFVDINMYSILIHLSFGERLKLSDLDEDQALLQTRNLMRAAPPVLVCFPAVVNLVFALLSSHLYETRNVMYVKYFGSMPKASKRAVRRWQLSGLVVRTMLKWMRCAKVKTSFLPGCVTPPPAPLEVVGPPTVSMVVQVILKVFLEHGSSDFFASLFNPMYSANPVDSLTAIFFQCLGHPSQHAREALTTDAAPASPAMLFSPSGDVEQDGDPSTAVSEALEEELDGTLTLSIDDILFTSDYATSPRDSIRLSFSLSDGGAGTEDPAIAQVRETVMEITSTHLPLVMLASREATTTSSSPTKLRYLPSAQCLHHCLYNYPNFTKVSQASWYGNAMCSNWLTALEKRVTVRSLLEDSSSRNIACNALGLCEYFVDRLHAGGVTPIPELLKALSHVAARFQEANLSDPAKAMRTIAHRCVLLVLSPNFNKRDPVFLTPILQTLVHIAPNVLSVKACSMDFLRLVSSRLFSLLEVTDVRGFTLILFRTVLRIVRETNIIDKLFVRASTQNISKRVDVFRGGLELIFFADNNTQFLRWYECQQDLPGDNVFTFFSRVRTKYTSVQQHKEVHFGKVFLYDVQLFRNKFTADVECLTKEGHRLWNADRETVRGGGVGMTWVDCSLLGDVCTKHACVLTDTLEKDVQRAEVSSSGAVLSGARQLGPEGYLLQDDPCDALVYYVPQSCFGMFPSMGGSEAGGESVKVSSNVGPLTHGARTLLALLLGHHQNDAKITCIVNAYKVIGIISTPVLLIVTTNELIAVSYGRVTESGDIVVSMSSPDDDITNITPGSSHATTKKTRWFGRPTAGAMRRMASNLTRDHSRALRQQIAQTGGGDNHTSVVWRYPSTALRTLTCRSLHHNPAALEIEYVGAQRIFLAVLDRSLTLHSEERDLLAQCLLQTSTHMDPKLHTVKSIISDLRGYTKSWQCCDMSTFEYLLHVNNAAGRTFLDYNQYPVFPWVQAGERDLSKPMGAQEATRASEFRQRFEEWPDPEVPRFHYGSHYSSSAVVLYYKVRTQPNTSMAVLYQGGKLDVPDRLFHSLAEAWYSSSRGSRTDVKELIPEFFDVNSAGAAAMFVNANKVALGVNRDGVELNDVVLKDKTLSPFAFLVQHRESLECDAVSASVELWIDLIFGVAQRGAEAERALNVFHPLTYEDGVETALATAATEEDCKAIVAALDNFGITPRCVFGDTPHPRRSLRSGPNSAQILLNHAREFMSRNSDAHTSPHACVDIGVRGYDGGTILASSNWKARCVVGVTLTSLTWLPTHRCLRSTLDGLVYQTDEIVTSVRISKCGSILLLGTSLGTLIVGTRNIHGKYDHVTTCAGSHRDPITSVSVDEEKGLALTLSSTTVCVWRLTATYCHIICRHVVTTETVTAACMIPTVFTLVCVPSGIMLYTTSSPHTAVFLTPLTTQSPITAVHAMSCRDWCPLHVVVTGHRDGAITFWELTLNPLALRSHVSIASSVHLAVTALTSRKYSMEIFVGYDNGAVVSLTLPDTDSTALMGSSLQQSNDSVWRQDSTLMQSLTEFTFMEHRRESWRVQTDGLWATRERTLHSANSLRTKLSAHERACEALERATAMRLSELEAVRATAREVSAELEMKRQKIEVMKASVEGCRWGKSEEKRRRGRRRVPEADTPNHMVHRVMELEEKIRRHEATHPGSDVGYNYLLIV